MTTSSIGAGGAWPPPRVPGRGMAEPSSVPAVRPVGPADAAPAFGEARSGIDVEALSAPARDTLTARAPVPAAELAELLETARGALVRGDAHAVLAALDRGWVGAAQSESGWYFRSAALALLGLPGEAVRVLLEADAHQPASAALRFLESVVRDATHDAVGARSALAQARALAPEAPLLSLWEAILLARRGERAAASARLHALSATIGEESLLRWARAAIVRAGADAVRADAVRADAVRADAVRADAVRGVAIDPLARDAGALAAGLASREARSPDDQPVLLWRPEGGERGAGTIGARRLQGLDAAVAALASRLAHRDGDELAREVQALLQAMSGQGHLRDAARPEQWLAVRRVLTMLLASVTGSPTRPGLAPTVGADPRGAREARGHLTPIDGGPVIDGGASEHAERIGVAILSALQRGAVGEAERRLARTDAALPGAVHAVLQEFVRAARGDAGAVPSTPHELMGSIGGLPADGLLPAVRFGLALLAYASPRLEAASLTAADSAQRGTRAPLRDASAPSFVPVPRAWRRLRWPLAAAAVLALVLGHPLTALLCAAGACWLLLR